MPEFERVLEEQIEDCIVADPERYLEPGITLILRQPVIESGRPDLIGVDGNGRLVIYELKAVDARGPAITQVVRYHDEIAAMSVSDLRRLVERYSGRHDIGVIRDFTEWYRDRFPSLDLDDLFPPRCAVVAIGADSTARRRIETFAARGVEVALIDLSKVELELSPADATDGERVVLRRARLKTSGPHAAQLRENQHYYDCQALFGAVSEQIERRLSKLTPKTYPIGKWHYADGSPRIGVDVFRAGLGAVGILIFKNAVTPEIRDALDPIRDQLVWQGDTYIKAVDTVLILHSLAEWEDHRAPILRMIDQINAA